MNVTQIAGDHPFNNALRIDQSAPRGLPSLTSIFTHPDKVVRDQQLTHAEKQELLASWASDVRGVPNAPALRQLDNGSVIHIDDVLNALRSLDDDADQSPTSDLLRSFARMRRRRSSCWSKAALRRNHSEDDDDSPPCPAMIAAPPRKPLLSGDAVNPHLVLAA